MFMRDFAHATLCVRLLDDIKEPKLLFLTFAPLFGVKGWSIIDVQ